MKIAKIVGNESVEISPNTDNLYYFKNNTISSLSYYNYDNRILDFLAESLFGRAHFNVLDFDSNGGNSVNNELDEFFLKKNDPKLHKKLYKTPSRIMLNVTTFDDDVAFIINISHQQKFQKIKRGHNVIQLEQEITEFYGYLDMHKQYKNVLLSAKLKSSNLTTNINIYAKYIKDKKNIEFADFPSYSENDLSSSFNIMLGSVNKLLNKLLNNLLN